MKEPKTRYETLSFYLVALLTLLVDQLSKFGIVAALALGQSRPLIDGVLRLTYVRNFGAAFSLFWGHTGSLSWVAVLIAVGVVIYQWRERPRDLLVILSLGFLFGGAMGNFLDRVMFGYVRDMVDLRWHDQNIWPIFNVADMAVLAGVGLLMIHSLAEPKRRASKI